MASLIYNEFKRANMAGEIDLNADDIRVALVMTNTTVDTENDGMVNVDDFATLDECDGANYVRNDEPLGTGQLRNMVMEESRKHFGQGDYVAPHDNDVFFKPGWLGMLIKCYEFDGMGIFIGETVEDIRQSVIDYAKANGLDC